MADEEHPEVGPVGPGEARQMRAWFARARPDEYASWSRALLSADIGGDDDAYERLERDAVALWREHRDDPLRPEQRRAVDVAQGVAWLGQDLGLTWLRAHGLALGRAEQNDDFDRLLGLWRKHRADLGLPDSAGQHVVSLSRVREDRLTQAKTWHRAHDPAGHAQWQTRRRFADTLGDEADDDRIILRAWTRHHAAGTPGQAPARDVLPGRQQPARDTRPVGDAARLDAAELNEDRGPVRGL